MPETHETPETPETPETHETPDTPDEDDDRGRMARLAAMSRLRTVAQAGRAGLWTRLGERTRSGPLSRLDGWKRSGPLARLDGWKRSGWRSRTGESAQVGRMAWFGPGTRPRRIVVPAVIAAAAVLGVCLIHNGTTMGSGPPQPAAAAALGPSGPPSAKPKGPAQPQAMPFSVPTRIRIPALHVNAPVMQVGLDGQGWIGAPPPTKKNLAGWFKNAAAPGSQGTAIIDGHVDNMSGPAVFYGLGALKKGDHIEVTRADNHTAIFDIYGIEVFAKNNFPSARVYGDVGRPELRVITCGGGFTKHSGYDGNVVVFARLSKAD